MPPPPRVELHGVGVEVAGQVQVTTSRPDYVERRTAEGLSKREIIRCLKRYVAREIHNNLPQPARTDSPAKAIQPAP